MAGATGVYGLRYPELVDPPDGAALGKNLADDVEAELVRVDDAIGTLDGRADAVELLEAIPVTGNTATGIAMGVNVVNTGDGSRAWRRNGVVTLEIYAAQSEGTSGNIVLYVPPDWAPPFGVRFSVNLSSNTTERAAYLNADGMVTMEGGLTSTQSVYGSVTYVCGETPT